MSAPRPVAPALAGATSIPCASQALPASGTAAAASARARPTTPGTLTLPGSRPAPGTAVWVSASADRINPGIFPLPGVHELLAHLSPAGRAV